MLVRTICLHIIHGAPGGWIPNFIRDCLSKTLDTVVCNKATSYRTVLQLDAKIRQYPTHVPVSHSSEIMSETIGTIMQHHMGDSMREICGPLRLVLENPP